MIERQSQRVYKYQKYPKDSKICSDRGFVNIDNGGMGGTHWVCFIVKYKTSYYFDSFGGCPDRFLPKQLPKPTIYHKYKIQDINLNSCGSYCLYFSYLIERENYSDTILKTYFG